MSHKDNLLFFHRESKRFLIGFGSLLIMFVLIPVTNVFAQTDNKLERIFIKDVLSPEPIHITELEVGGMKVPLNKAFSGGDDWLDGLTITFKNTTKRTITYVNFAVDVRKKGDLIFSGGDNVVYGFNPLSKERKRDEPRTLLPNETVVFKVPEDSIDEIKGLLNRQGKSVNDVNECQILVGRVVFADGIHWSGRYLKPDPQNPGKFIPE